MLFELKTLIKWDIHQSRCIFSYPLTRELLVAKHFEEEIAKIAKLSQDKGLYVCQRKLAFNQLHLANDIQFQRVLIFICEAVNNKKIDTKQLLDIIDLSRKKLQDIDSKNEHDDEKIQDKYANLNGDKKSQSEFAVAAANAITILNITGYSFSN